MCTLSFRLIAINSKSNLNVHSGLYSKKLYIRFAKVSKMYLLSSEDISLTSVFVFDMRFSFPLSKIRVHSTNTDTQIPKHTSTNLAKIHMISYHQRTLAQRLANSGSIFGHLPY